MKEFERGNGKREGNGPGSSTLKSFCHGMPGPSVRKTPQQSISSVPFSTGKQEGEKRRNGAKLTVIKQVNPSSRTHTNAVVTLLSRPVRATLRKLLNFDPRLRRRGGGGGSLFRTESVEFCDGTGEGDTEEVAFGRGTGCEDVSARSELVSLRLPEGGE